MENNDATKLNGNALGAIENKASNELLKQMYMSFKLTKTILNEAIPKRWQEPPHQMASGYTGKFPIDHDLNNNED